MEAAGSLAPASTQVGPANAGVQAQEVRGEGLGVLRRHWS
jgi:hypothetical protein